MPGSWVQHSTVVAQRSQAEVSDLFRMGGRPHVVEGKDPLVISDPESIWYVDRGSIDLFFVDLREGSARGRRAHFVRLDAGDLILGVAPLASLSPGLSFGLLAVGVSGTRIIEMRQDDLRASATKRGALDAVNGLIDGWVRHISRALARGAQPPKRAEANPGSVVDLEPGQALSAGPKTIWFSQSSGSTKLVGLSTVRAKPKSWLPLTRETWLVSEATASLHFIDTQTYFRADPDWVSLTRYHRFVLDALARARVIELASESRQFGDRAEYDGQEIDRTLLALAAVDPEELAATQRTDPLFLAISAVGKAIGVKVLPSRAGSYGHGSPVDEIARASRVRTRSTVRPHDLDTKSTGPLLGFRGEESHPVALIPRTFGGYDLFDPAAGTNEKLTRAMAEELQPKCIVFYKPFPARKLSPIDIARFALHGARNDIVMLAITGLGSGILGMVLPLAMGEMIDSIIPAAEVGLLISMGVLLLSVTFSQLLLHLARGIATMRLEVRASSAVEAAVWDRLLSLPPPFFRRFSAGDLATRANAIEEIRTHLSGNVLDAVMTSAFALMNLVVMLGFDARLGAISALLAMGSVLLAVIIGVTTLLIRRNLADTEGRLSSVVLQLLSGITKLRIAGAERRAFSMWAKEFVTKRALEIRAREVENLMQIVSSTYPVLMTGAIFAMVAAKGAQGQMSAGQFIGFYASFGIFLGGVVELASRGVAMLDLIPIIARARPIFDAVPEVDDHKTHPGDLRGALQVNRVSFRYAPDGPLILDDVDFDVEPGEFVAIVGSSASGKSTLLRLMLGFETPSAGGVYYDRQDLLSLDVSEVRRQIGVVLQNGQPIAGTLFENIVGSRNVPLDDAWAAARMAGLEEDIKRLPMGMHTVLGQGGQSLSGGQRQRLLIARALLGRPKIIYLDEATSALDNNTQKIVMTSLANQATRVVIAHRLSTIKDADKIIVLERGKVVQTGTYQQLIEVEGTFKEMARRQIA